MQVVATQKKRSDKSLVTKVRSSDKEAFEEIFFRYYTPLCSIAIKITESSDSARDIVQEVFFRIWRQRESWEINQSLQAYLYRAVWNEALNAKEKRKKRNELSRKYSRYSDARNIEDDKAERTKLVNKIWQIVEDMPKRRRFVFTLHRKHGLSYKEISEVMKITRKTVENHMGLALKEIRECII